MQMSVSAHTARVHWRTSVAKKIGLSVTHATVRVLKHIYGPSMDNKDRRKLEEKLVTEWDKLREEFHMDDPVWGPLEKVLPYRWCGAFMYMGRTEGIHLYKHGFTRHYLNLDDDGNAYRYLPASNRYVPMNRLEAIENVFEGLALMGIDRSTAYDDEAVRRRRKAIEASGRSHISLAPRGKSAEGSRRRGSRKQTRKQK